MENKSDYTVRNTVAATLDAIGDVAVAKPAAFLAERLAERTAAMSEKARLEATARLLDAALQRYIVLCYEPLDGDGTPAGIDPVSAYVRIPAPFGHSYREWGLRRSEAQVLNAYLRSWSRSTKGAPPVFVFNVDRNRWAANLAVYPDLKLALVVVGKGVFTAALVAQIEQTLRARDARRRDKKR